ncbi:MAG: hypothetical protein ACXWCX_01745 [Burkholderiales bacterium]
MLKKARLTTVVLVLGIAGTVLWLRSSLMAPFEWRHIGSGQICFKHVGQWDTALPRICVTGEARAPRDGVVVILSRENLARFLKVVDERKDAAPAERAAFGSYEIDNSIETEKARRILPRSEMQALIKQLMGLLVSPEQQRAAEKAALDDTLDRLKKPAAASPGG